MTASDAPAAVDVPPAPPRPQALILRRMLALFYDFWPMLAVWMLLSLLFNIAYTLTGHDQREVVGPLTPLAALLWLCCWAITGAYAVFSWRRGGQTLGMRPWRIRVVATDSIGTDPVALAPKTLWTRYAVGTLSLLLGGLGFWWAWFDREKRTWHDRASGTRVVAVPKRKS